MTTQCSYDYIIAGAGCAGLSLLMHGIEKNAFVNKKVLLIDKSKKDTNDRTWCFWEKNNDWYQHLVSNQWGTIEINTSFDNQKMDISPYIYKCIQALDFYTYCINKIKTHQNIEIIYGEIEEITSNAQETFVIISQQKITGQFIFNSLPPTITPKSNKEVTLYQHFKGIVIETSEDHFDNHCPTFADFNVSQKEGTAFVYIIPQTKNKALIEYTFFNEHILNDDEYDKLLHKYLIENLNIKHFTILHAEKGVIPMTSSKFPIRNNNIIYIGTAGGQTKASTGYTFTNIQKHSKKIIAGVLQGNDFSTLTQKPKKYTWYDHVFLNVLKSNQIHGDIIFSNIFKKCTATQAFQFLDEESNFITDLKVILAMPKIPFIKAALKTF